MQLPVVSIYNRIADTIFVTSQPDANKFPHRQFYIVKGGIDLNSIEKYKREHQTCLDDGNKLYDCVFMGRFHPQKGVIELVHMWKSLLDYLPDAQLVMIGEGPLFTQVKRLIIQLDLSNNIRLTGSILDNDKKFTLFAASKIVAHPALYDSGGMAAAEAMAFGLPGVSFDLKALKTYYPKGMLKITPFDYQAFVEMMRKLLTEYDFYKSHSKKALDLVYKEWNWDNKGKEIQDIIVTL
jgi:glycosyltransferase involved in cell wall biosynthesis